MAAWLRYSDYDAIALSELVRRGEVSAAEVVEAALEHIAAVEPRLNAVVGRMEEAARREAQRVEPTAPLAGVPLLLKDLTAAYAGVPLSSGSRFYEGYVPDHDSELVRRYRSSGMVCVGKTNTPEFGLLPVTEPALFGATKNPYDVHLTAGGSSGGAAAAVAAGLVPIAHGSDGGGSLRIPASCCGVFGFKPTRARTPTGPDASEFWLGFAIAHVITRSVRDSALALDVSTGPETTSPYYPPPEERAFVRVLEQPPRRLRIALCAEGILSDKVHPDCRAAVLDAAKLCTDLGHDVEEARPSIKGDEVGMCFFLLACAFTASNMRLAQKQLGKKARRGDFELTTRMSGLLGERFSAEHAITSIRVLQAHARTILRFHERYDVFLTPTLGSPPPVHGALAPKGLERLAQRAVARLKLRPLAQLPPVVRANMKRIYDFIPFTPLANFTGQPSMSVPLYWNSKGLPIGTMFSGRFGEDATLFQLAHQLEQARPWANRRPKLHAAKLRAEER